MNFGDRTRLGDYGAIWCHDTLAYTAPTGTFFHAIYFAEATVFASLGIAAVPYPGSAAAVVDTVFASNSTALVSFTFNAGSTIYGMWTSFKINSGGLIAYKARSKTYQPG